MSETVLDEVEHELFRVKEESTGEGRSFLKQLGTILKGTQGLGHCSCKVASELKQWGAETSPRIIVMAYPHVRAYSYFLFCFDAG